MQSMVDDPLLSLPLFKNKEICKCSTCINASSGLIGGNRGNKFHGALEHIKTSQHQENFEKIHLYSKSFPFKVYNFVCFSIGSHIF